MRANDVMTKGAVTVPESATVFEAAELMINTRVSGLPVVDGRGALVGVVSEADLLGRAELATSQEPNALLQEIADDVAEARAFVKSNARLVRDVMTRNVTTVTEDMPVRDVAALMLRHRVKRLPVMRGSQVVGIVSRINLVQAIIARAGAAGSASTPVAAPAGAPDAAQLLSDDRLQDEVEAAVKAHRWKSARIEVTVHGSVVHLWGVVADEAVRQAYRIAAERVPGVKDIVDHTHIIAPLGPGRRAVW